MNIISIGEVLWDVFGDTEHLGGAAFNFGAHAKILGHSVSFISAVGQDQRGRHILEGMDAMGLPTRFVRQEKDHPTGIVTVSLDTSGQPHFIIHRPAAYDFPELSDGDLGALSSRRPDWIYFGTLFQMSPKAKALTLKVLDANPEARRFYDVNLRENCYEASLVNELMSLATAVKLNEQEVDMIQSMFGWSYRSLEDFCKGTARKFGWEAVCVTRGEAGCVLLVGDNYAEAEGYEVRVADTVGAGDAFAAAFVHGMGWGWPAQEVADFANRVGALVASRPGGTPSWTIEEADALSRQ
ncbi:MAG: PfkB family carbohydrate kinase [Terriglobia bacterium]|jgi:fructokinase